MVGLASVPVVLLFFVARKRKYKVGVTPTSGFPRGNPPESRLSNGKRSSAELLRTIISDYLTDSLEKDVTFEKGT